MMCSIVRTLGRLALLAVLLAPASACTALGLEGATSQRSLLARQKARWTNTGITSYRFTYDVTCVCGSVDAPVEIEVRSGLVAAAEYATGDEPLPPNLQGGLPTIDDLFGIIERALVDRAHLLEVSYHPSLGYPTRIAVDRSFNVAADEVIHVVGGLTPLSPE